jgi:prophage regulatory protein
MTAELKSPARVLRARDVCTRVGFAGTSALYRAMEREGFPKPIRIGERQVGWLVAEIDEFLQARIAERDAGGTWTSLGDAAARAIEKVRP